SNSAADNLFGVSIDTAVCPVNHYLGRLLGIHRKTKYKGGEKHTDLGLFVREILQSRGLCDRELNRHAFLVWTMAYGPSISFSGAWGPIHVAGARYKRWENVNR